MEISAKPNRICSLLGIKYPVIAGGMVWCSGWRLASAVSHAGGLGLLGAGSMHPDTLEEHILKMKETTSLPWGVNLPLMYPEMDRAIKLLVRHHVNIVFTSAGSPDKYTSLFHDHGIKVVHVVSNTRFACKCQQEGVDAIVAEGVEAGGHNGRDELTTMTLVPQVRKAVDLPVIAAGGIASGQALLAAMALGAEGVQIGTLFALSQESSASQAFKDYCLSLPDTGTLLTLRKLSPTRMARNPLSVQLQEAETHGADAALLQQILGEKASKRGIFEGDLEHGELVVGQIASACGPLRTVAEIMKNRLLEYSQARSRIQSL